MLRMQFYIHKEQTGEASIVPVILLTYLINDFPQGINK